ncbi:WD40 repeat-like protein [Leucosporidium creatinivorum]|uniref:WD40 repeat-like protein n=1 Tax=Leucosporidium creatinivorum TaxID=106004 RepID=A0A1Y2G644_9BASI|nr:WD40 repeat-like protein [Leucosporidium creatinivorum]
MATDLQLPPYIDSVSSLAFHPTNPNLLVGGSWDRNVYLHDLTSPSNVRKVAVRGSVLDVAWAPESSTKVFVGGLAKEVRSVDFETNESQLIATHDEPVKCVEFSSELNAVISASWDSTVRISPLTTPGTSLILPVADKVYSLALSKSKVVVAMGGRQVWIYDIAALKEALEQGTEGKDVVVWQKRESSLKFMTRAVKAMPTDQGYTTTSIEGRVAVEFFDPSPEAQAKKYAFKCHRQVIEGVDTVYPVQGLAFNPVHGTFATGGGDCTVSIWDPLAKKRLRQFPKYPSPISALEFNCDGTKLAVAFSEQDEGGVAGEKNGNGVIIRECGDEVKPKAKA